MTEAKFEGITRIIFFYNFLRFFFFGPRAWKFFLHKNHGMDSIACLFSFNFFFLNFSLRQFDPEIFDYEYKSILLALTIDISATNDQTENWWAVLKSWVNFLQSYVAFLEEKNFLSSSILIWKKWKKVTFWLVLLSRPHLC